MVQCIGGYSRGYHFIVQVGRAVFVLPATCLLLDISGITPVY